MSRRSRTLVSALFVVLSAVAIANAADLKFHAAPGPEPVIGRYLVTLDASVGADLVLTSAEVLARSYGGQLELYASSDERRFVIAMLPSRARTLSSDARVREVVELAEPDQATAVPPIPSSSAASLTRQHLVPVAQDSTSSGTYLYDGSGNIKFIGADSFVYDSLGRLNVATVQGNQQSYTYDAFGNRLSATRANGAIGCAGGTACEAAVTVLAQSNHLSGVTYDDAGNVTSGFGAAYIYDGTGMVTGAAVGSDQRDFAYTADDERIAVRQGVSWTWTVREQGGKVLREFTATETSSPFGLTTHSWSKDYIWRDGLLLASVFPNTAGSTNPLTTYHYHLDHLGTPRLVTRGDGTMAGKHTYYPFGAEMDLTPKEGSAALMKFTGHERDIVAGDSHSVDYMHARYYNGNLGRFLSVDPGPVDPERPQSWNRYSYVSNNPIVYSDPDGREQRFNPTTYNWKGLLTSLDRAGAVLRSAGKVLDKALPVAFDVIVFGEMIVKFTDTGEGMQPAVEKLEADANVVVREAETEGIVLFRGGSSIQARDSELKVINGEVQPLRGPSLNTDPAKVSSHGEPHRIESMPGGLTTKQWGKDPGHYEIIPVAPMSKVIFQQLLDQIIRAPF